MTADLMQAAQTLADVLARENDALKRLDFRTAIALVPAKEAALLSITKGRSPAPATDRNPVLAALGRRLNSLAAENRALLERAITVQTRIVGIIVRAAAPPAPAGRYAANGYKNQPRKASAMALSARA
ncbi:hypothetical protein [Rhodopila sp.]|uniref:hypothetical protein n=1 Tax=Rhodopila sp. TaxID=2480087 RepID=UPI003D137080